MAITNKIFSHFDACGGPGFTYSQDGRDITTELQLREIRACYEIQINSGPWKKSWCSAATHRRANNAEIETELESNATPI